MNCLSFPNIFKGNSAKLEEGKSATKECLKLLYATEKGSMFGDPDIGVRIKRYTFNQNNYVLRDVLIDELYEQTNIFTPQVLIERNNIEIKQVGNKLNAEISVKHKSDFTTSTYNLKLFENDEE